MRHSLPRTGGLPLFRAPLQSAFLLILKSCCTVNLFQSRNLFKWIWLDNINQASPVHFFFSFFSFFYCIYLREHLYLYSLWRDQLHSARKEIDLFWLKREAAVVLKIYFLFSSVWWEIQCQRRNERKELDPGEINHLYMEQHVIYLSESWITWWGAAVINAAISLSLTLASALTEQAHSRSSDHALNLPFVSLQRLYTLKGQEKCYELYNHRHDLLWLHFSCLTQI